MANLPVRKLGTQGIITDVLPFDLPMTAWSGGTNVRFSGGKAQRAPVFRAASVLTPTLVDAGGVMTFRPDTGYDVVFCGDTNGRLAKWVAGTGLTDVSETGFVASPSGEQFTSCALGGLLYVNRAAGPPRWWGSTSTQFAVVPNLGTPAWTCNILRAYKDFLVAFAVTRSGTFYGSMVKWSDATQYGTVPATWDPTATNALAGENVLSEMNSPIVDAGMFRDAMMIFGSSQTWAMRATGEASFVFRFDKLFDGKGAIARNCCVEANGMHFVFGPDDLWVHDGTQPTSIATERVKDFVFQNLDASLSHFCHVWHDPTLTSVGFAFPSSDGVTPFSKTSGCNKAVVYNYANNTWGPVDLPCTTGAALANADLVTTWDTLGAGITWDNWGGTWSGQSDGYKPAPFMVGNADSDRLTQAKLYASDPMDVGTRISLPADTAANSGAFLERLGIDLDEAGVPVQNFKWVRGINPQAVIFRNVPMTVSFGACETPQGMPSWTTAVEFDPQTEYQISARESGRYLSIRFGVAELADFQLAGFDADVIGGGRR